MSPNPTADDWHEIAKFADDLEMIHRLADAWGVSTFDAGAWLESQGYLHDGG